MTILVTGGAGFIGSALVRQLIAEESETSVITVDKLTYAGSVESLQPVAQSPRHHFELADVCDASAMQALFQRYQPKAVVHLASETHVDRSIDAPAAFIKTNLVGTYTMLEAACAYWRNLSPSARADFRFLHVSTDEVYGSLGEAGFFTEETPYAPSSPYSATKAGADHLVRAWHTTYGLPVLITNCSNNFGPYQFPEKLIPLMILSALEGKSLPVYGDGGNVRDWLFVEDHCRALRLVLGAGRPGETYNVGGNNQTTNLEVVYLICSILDEVRPRADGASYDNQVRFVTDRPGHDRRYAIDASKLRRELGWQPQESFESALRKTVEWYLVNENWWRAVRNGSYQGERLGVLR